MRGLGGNDRLSGSSGDDVYGGSDKIRGNNGDDRLMDDDGRYDEVWCGSGTDYAYADVKDTVYYGWETVQR
jgi:Ca2+-binding RTX toxin-like protein